MRAIPTNLDPRVVAEIDATLDAIVRDEGVAMPPMHFPTLMAECDPPRDVAALTDELIARKAVTRELGEGPLPEVIARFVAEEFEAARGAFEGVAAVASAAVREEADAVFWGVVERSHSAP